MSYVVFELLAFHVQLIEQWEFEWLPSIKKRSKRFKVSVSKTKGIYVYFTILEEVIERGARHIRLNQVEKGFEILLSKYSQHRHVSFIL